MVATAFADAASDSRVTITEETLPIHKLLGGQGRQQLDGLLKKASAPGASADDKAAYVATMFQLIVTNQFGQMLADPPKSQNETDKIEKIKTAVTESLKNMTRVFEGLAAEGHANSMLMASQMYANGLGVDKNLDTAQSYAEKALAGGAQQAQQLLDQIKSLQEQEKSGPRYKVLNVKPFKTG